jgi:hypothetical protein
MAENGVFCYNSLMRLLIITSFIGLLTLSIRLPQTSNVVLTQQDRQALRNVLHEVEYDVVKKDSGDCAMLSDLPLYENAPSTADWQTFCLAEVTRDRRGCGKIRATMLPDLQIFCDATFRSRV